MFETHNDPHPDPREGAAGAGLPPPVAALKAAGARLAEVDYHRLEAAALTTTVTVLARVANQIAAATAAATDAALTTGTVRDSGAATATQWLVETGGGSTKKARRTAGRASRLRDLPGTEKALSEGEVTPEHVDVIIGAVRRGRLGTPEDTEQALLETAREATPEELRRHVKTREEAAQEGSLLADENAAYARRRAWAGTTKAGTYRLEAELDPVSGAKVATALEAFTQLDDASVPEAERRSAAQRRADGLVAMATAALDGGTASTDHGICPHVSVLMDADVLAARSGGSAVTDTGQVISGEAARRLACDAAITRIITKGASQVLDVGRATQAWPAPQWRAIVARDRTCRFPGCDRPPSWCQAHHVQWWENGGPTKVDNGVLLCSHHHRCVHEGGWELSFDPATGVVSVTSPDKTIVRTSDPPGFDLTLSDERPTG